MFGRVTPTRIQETLHELTTLKGVDDVGEVSQFSLFHGNDKNSRLDYDKVAGSFMRRVKSSYLQNLKSSKSSAIVNDASRETVMDVVVLRKDDVDDVDDVVKKTVDNPQSTTIRSDIGVSEGEDDQQQYRQMYDDTEKFMVEENDDNYNEELNLNDLDSTDTNHETSNNDKLEDKTIKTGIEDSNQNTASSYGDNLSFYNSVPGDVVYDIIYDYQTPASEVEEYYQDVEDGLILSTLQSHNQIIGNNIEAEYEDVEDSPDYFIEQEENSGDQDYYLEPEENLRENILDTEQGRQLKSKLDDNVYSHSLNSPVLVSGSEELFKIPVILDFEAFGSETFSNARQRIPEQFRKLIHQPWTHNAW